jgi:GTPase SAR1 family protein
MKQIRFIHETFDDDTQSTLSIEFLSKIVSAGGQRIRLQLWDMAA